MNFMSKFLLKFLFVVTLVSSTLSAAWSPPINITLPGYTQEQSVAVDASGKAMIVFINSSNGLVLQAQASQLINGVPTAAHVFPLQNAHISAFFPNVAVNASGDAVAVWMENDLLTSHVIAARFTNGVWGSPVAVSNPSSFVQTDGPPGVVLDDSGIATVVWCDLLSGTYHIVAAQGLSNGGWSTPQIVQTSNSTLLSPVLSGSPSGHCLAVWVNIGSDLIGTAYFDGSSWSATDIAGSNVYTSCGLNQPAVSMNASNNASILWQNDDGGISSVSLLNGSFGPVEIVSTNVNGSYLPSIGIDASGNSVAVWEEYNGVDAIAIKAARRINNSWTTSITLFSSLTSVGEPNVIEVAVQASGDAVATWLYSGNSLNLSHIDAIELTNGVWGAIVTLSNLIPVSAQETGMNAAGYAVVVWNNVTSPDTILEAAIRPRFSIVVEPATGLVGQRLKNKFFAQTEYLNTMTWQASPSTSVVQYAVLRDGKQIGSVAAGAPLVFVDHNRKKGQSYTYTIIAVDGSGNQSTGITIVL